MPSNDRRKIARLLQPFFTAMEGATSEEWGAFLDKMTGLETPGDMKNAEAFDRWRQKLGEQGYTGIWEITEEKTEAIKKRAAELLDLEAERLLALPALMEKLRDDAPIVTAAELLRDKNK